MSKRPLGASRPRRSRRTTRSRWSRRPPTNVEVTKKGDYIFRACFIDSFQGRRSRPSRGRTSRRERRRLLVDSKSDYSVGLADAFRRAFTALGGRIVAELKYSEGDSDFSAQLTALQAAAPGRGDDPRLLHRRGTYRAAGAVARDRSQPSSARTDGTRPSSRRSGAPPSRALTSPTTTRWTIPLPRCGRSSRTTARSYGTDPDSIATLSYDAARLIADAIKRAGSTEGKRVRDALASTAGFPGVTGTITMDADRNPVKPAVILKVEGGSSATRRRFRPEAGRTDRFPVSRLTRVPASGAGSSTNSSNDTIPGPAVAIPERPAAGFGSVPWRSGLPSQVAAICGPSRGDLQDPHSLEIAALPRASSRRVPLL